MAKTNGFEERRNPCKRDETEQLLCARQKKQIPFCESNTEQVGNDFKYTPQVTRSQSWVSASSRLNRVIRVIKKRHANNQSMVLAETNGKAVKQTSPSYCFSGG